MREYYYFCLIFVVLTRSIESTSERGPPIYTKQTNSHGRNTVKAYGVRIPSGYASTTFESTSSCGCTWACWSDTQCSGVSYTHGDSIVECRLTQLALDKIYFELAENSIAEADLDKSTLTLKNDGYYHVVVEDLKTRNQNIEICKELNPSSSLIRILSQDTANIFLDTVPNWYFMHADISQNETGLFWGDGSAFGARGEDSLIETPYLFNLLNDQLVVENSFGTIKFTNKALTWAYCLVDPFRQGSYGDTSLD